MGKVSSEQEPAVNQQPQGAPARMMAKQMGIYYSNCAMVATSPRDISLFFGRYIPATTEGGGPSLAELYEQQIYMTLEQAEDLVRILKQTVDLARTRKAPSA